jgi:predicted peptidase
MDNSIKKVTAYTYVGDFGQTVYQFALDCAGSVPELSPADFKIVGGRKDIHGNLAPSGITAVSAEGGRLILKTDPFVYFNVDFSISGLGNAAKFSFSKADITSAVTKTADEFSTLSESGVIYRLHSPEVSGPRPLVLFLHGGGECGTDHNAQLLGTMGAVNIAERWPDVYVMAPQAPGGPMPAGGMQQVQQVLGNPFDMRIGKLPDSGKTGRGWNRDYLVKVCQIIRNMIAAGKVDPRRVCVTGLSMGGGGTLRAMSVDPDLFAAAAPVCPSMNGETYMILGSIRNTAVWVSTAYIDHQPARHAYIAGAYQKLLDDGITEAHMTIYTPEELAVYGIGVCGSLTNTQLLEENHNSWVLTYHNEHGILDWLISVAKD